MFLEYIIGVEGVAESCKVLDILVAVRELAVGYSLEQFPQEVKHTRMISRIAALVRFVVPGDKASNLSTVVNLVFSALDFASEYARQYRTVYVEISCRFVVLAIL